MRRLSFQAMVWYSHEDGWNRKSYVEAVSYCAKRKMKLLSCTQTVHCTDMEQFVAVDTTHR